MSAGTAEVRTHDPVPSATSTGSRVRHGLTWLGRHLVSTYLSFDPRSLGLFRIALGLVLLIDLYQRYLGVDYWYTDAGLVPTQLMKSPGVRNYFSLFLYASTHSQAVLGMALCAVVYILFTIGFSTRVFHALAILCVVSLNSRIFLLENSGHSVLNLLAIWTLFLPLGRRLSVDAVLAARRARLAGVPQDGAALVRPVVSLAVLALLLQFSVIYWFSVVHKTGPMWWDGTAVHYVLHDERMNTGLGVWARENLPRVVIEALSWGTLVVEAVAVVFFLSPFWPRHLRLAAVLTLPALHAGFALALTLGTFSFAMISLYALLLAPQHWEWLERRAPLSRLRDSVAARVNRLPHLGRRGPSPRESSIRKTLASVRASRWLRYPVVGLREAGVLLFAAVCISDLAVTLPAWPAALRFRQPELFESIVYYPRIRQFWLMFTPQPPSTVVALAVEAVTEDGRVVDPYNEVASRYPTLPRSGIPTRLGQNQPFSDYTARMPKAGYEWCRMAFINWVLAYPTRTGNPSDRIVSFHVFRVESRIPPPGSTERVIPIFSPFLSFP